MITQTNVTDTEGNTVPGGSSSPLPLDSTIAGTSHGSSKKDSVNTASRPPNVQPYLCSS